jgi:hypothetical protein
MYPLTSPLTATGVEIVIIPSALVQLNGPFKYDSPEVTTIVKT